MSATFGYVGWVGHHNLGDDAIADVLAEQLAPHRLVPAPVQARDLVALRRHPERRVTLAGSRLLLGGGTVIGRANWRLQLHLALRACSGGRAVMIGAAVEDPSFRGRRSFSSFGELARWKSLLTDRFESVTVRGPRSARLLAGIGVDATVVGDPALLATMRARRDPDGPIVVCTGYGDALRGTQTEVLDTLCRVLRRLDRPVRLISVNPGDRDGNQFIADELGAQATVADGFALATFDAQLDGASVVVAERLHAGILAAAAGFAPVMLAYQPKVDDFAASIGSIAHPTNRLGDATLTDAIANAGTDAECARVDGAVGVLVARLRQEVRRLHELAARSSETEPDRLSASRSS